MLVKNQQQGVGELHAAGVICRAQQRACQVLVLVQVQVQVAGTGAGGAGAGACSSEREGGICFSGSCSQNASGNTFSVSPTGVLRQGTLLAAPVVLLLLAEMMRDEVEGKEGLWPMGPATTAMMMMLLLLFRSKIIHGRQTRRRPLLHPSSTTSHSHGNETTTSATVPS